MSYFFYVTGSSTPTTFQPEACSNYNPNPLVSENALILPQKVFIPTSFPAGQLQLTQFPCFPPQNNFSHYPIQSLPHFQSEETKFRQVKKQMKNNEKQIESAKKNSESNLINHFFSFFSNREKSENTILLCISILTTKDCPKEKLLQLFYSTIHVLNSRRGRKYINKKILISLFEPESLLKIIPQIKQKLLKINQITITELCELFRRCCYSFYRTFSIDSILTSKRISSVAKEEHFRKRRKVIKGLYEELL